MRVRIEMRMDNEVVIPEAGEHLFHNVRRNDLQARRSAERDARRVATFYRSLQKIEELCHKLRAAHGSIGIEVILREDFDEQLREQQRICSLLELHGMVFGGCNVAIVPLAHLAVVSIPLFGLAW